MEGWAPSVYARYKSSYQIQYELVSPAAPGVASAGLPKDRLTLSGGSERKLNAQTYSGKLADKPIFTDHAVGSKEDQALVGKLNARDGKRREAVSPGSPTAETRRAERIAARIGRRIVWVKKLGANGLFDPTIDRSVIFLDPGSNRSAQVLVAHETAHTLAADNPAEFQKLVDIIDRAADQKEVDAFVERMDEATTPVGPPGC